MRVALTGSEGMLGHDILRAFKDVDVVGLTLGSLDITVMDSVIKTMREIKPDLLIHAAAYTDVDRAEAEPEKAYLVNGVGTRNLSMAAEELRCPLMYISTDYVFDGTKTGHYDEWDMTNPVNQYGLSKLMGERFVSSLTSRHYIVRTSWLYGKNGRNFVATIGRLLAERESLDVVDDQRGCPTYTVDLADKLRELSGKGYGTYHITNSGTCSWYEFAVKIGELTGIQRKINPVTTDKFPRPAKRPVNSVLGNTMLRLEGLEPARRWEDGLRDYLK
ncbi:MAG: dTDP-4-dehydrorhamnose reductase [Nitrospirae bacterium]|nr:dTDP-4-dehydrorhamnose reductase [Nitrospirota bacterium]